MFNPEQGFNNPEKNTELIKSAENVADFAFKIIEANKGKTPESSEEAEKIAQANGIVY